MSLSPTEMRRYSRQLLLPEMTGAKQARLAQSTVLLTGDPEVRAVCATYLTAAGVGKVSLDEDSTTADLTANAPPVASAAERWTQGSLLAVRVLLELIGLGAPQPTHHCESPG